MTKLTYRMKNSATFLISPQTSLLTVNWTLLHQSSIKKKNASRIHPNANLMEIIHQLSFSSSQVCLSLEQIDKNNQHTIQTYLLNDGEANGTVFNRHICNAFK